MAKLQTIAMLVALGLAGAAAAQEQTPPAPADTQATPPGSTEPAPAPSPDPSAASSPHQRDVTKKDAPETSPTESPDPQAASSPHQRGTVAETGAAMAAHAPKMVGMKVQSPTGEMLGSVVDVTMDASHQPEYVVISTGNDTTTAVPYSAVAPMVQGNSVIMDRTRLQNSPQVAQSELTDKSNSKWRADADKYWSRGAIRSASPGDYPQPKER